MWMVKTKAKAKAKMKRMMEVRNPLPKTRHSQE